MFRMDSPNGSAGKRSAGGSLAGRDPGILVSRNAQEEIGSFPEQAALVGGNGIEDLKSSTTS